MLSAEKFNFKEILIMRFARVSEEAIKRCSELTGEEFRLYIIIVFNTLSDGICHATITELAAICKLSYSTIAVRLSVLKQRGWLADSRDIKPLVGVNSPDKIYL